MEKDEVWEKMDPGDALKYLIDLRNSIKSYSREKAIEEKILVYLENHPKYRENVVSVDEAEWKWVE